MHLAHPGDFVGALVAALCVLLSASGPYLSHNRLYRTLMPLVAAITTFYVGYWLAVHWS